MVAKEKALFVSLTSCLIMQEDKSKSICDPGNCLFNFGITTSLMTYCEYFDPKYIFLYCNQPNLSMKALDPHKFNILASEVSSRLTKAFYSSVTQKCVPLIIHFVSAPKSSWQLPKDLLFKYLASQYSLDLTKCALIGGNKMDEKLTKYHNIPYYYQPDELIEMDMNGNFS